MNSTFDISSKSVVLSTHYRIYSASQALRDYIRTCGCKHLLYISHPLTFADDDSLERSYVEVSKGSKIEYKTTARTTSRIFAFNTILELFNTLYWVLSRRRKYNVFIGVDNFNALVGIVLKYAGVVEKVVYYTIDYFPTRFENKYLNSIYHFIDKICVRYADETWNVSREMVYARERYNSIKHEDYPRQYTVPIGIWYDKAPRLPFSKIDKKLLIFVGHLVPHMGVDLIVRSLPTIKKGVPGVHLAVIGGGEELENLKKLAKKHSVSSAITFYGWVRDRARLEKLMAKGAIGLAPFNTTILDSKVKNADPGKIKDYMLLGMPVIATDALSTAREIEEKKCGIIVDYEEEALAHAVIQLINSKSRLKNMRKNARDYVRQFDFGRIYEKNLKRVLSS